MGAAGQTTVVTVVMCDVVTYGLRSKGKTSLSPVRIRHEEWSADSRRVWLVSHGLSLELNSDYGALCSGVSEVHPDLGGHPDWSGPVPRGANRPKAAGGVKA